MKCLWDFQSMKSYSPTDRSMGLEFKRMTWAYLFNLEIIVYRSFRHWKWLKQPRQSVEHKDRGGQGWIKIEDTREKVSERKEEGPDVHVQRGWHHASQGKKGFQQETAEKASKTWVGSHPLYLSTKRSQKTMEKAFVWIGRIRCRLHLEWHPSYIRSKTLSPDIPSRAPANPGAIASALVHLTQSLLHRRPSIKTDRK